MKGKKEITVEDRVKDEFVRYARENGKDINQETFWSSANGIMLLFLFNEMADICNIVRNIKMSLDDLYADKTQDGGE